VLLDLMEAKPLWVTATGQSFLQKGIEDVTFTTIHFDGGRMAHIHVSWLDPHKIRRLTVVGAKKMAVVDDMEASEKMRIYDKGVDFAAGYVPYGEAVTLRIGDIQIPYIKVEEPLRLEAQHFVDCVRDGKTPRTDGREGLVVVQILEAAQQSLRARGAPVEVSDAL
jgi:predicted dehydrogenase